MIARPISNEQYIHKIKAINPSIKLVGEYAGSGVRAMHECLICGHNWMAFPTNIVAGLGCKKCADTNKKGKPAPTLSHLQYVERALKTSPILEVTGTYTQSHTKLAHKCRQCGHERLIVPFSVLKKNGVGCPKCKRRGNRQHYSEQRRPNL